MKTTVATISILVAIVASTSCIAATSQKHAVKLQKHATVHMLSQDAIAIVPPAIENSVFTNIPDLAPDLAKTNAQASRS